MPTFTGRLITPSNINGHYFYEVTRPAGVRRSSALPKIEDDESMFRLLYVNDAKVTQAGTDQLDLTILFTGTMPRVITVEMWLDGNKDTTDRPTVQDGKI